MATVLVVEDEDVTRLLLESGLRSAGHWVRAAASVAEAHAELAHSGVPEVVVTDMFMPGGSGLSLVSALRADPLLADVPVIFLSGRALPGDVERGEALGATYLTKPLSLPELTAAIDAAVQRVMADTHARGMAVAVIQDGKVGYVQAYGVRDAAGELAGVPTTEPAFGLPAVWIEERQRESAQMAGYTVVDCPTVVATHLSHLMQVNAARLLGRNEVQMLVEHVTKLAPKLIEDVIPKMIAIAPLQKVLQLLLEEGVHIRDFRSIVESLAEHAGTVTDPAELARRIRTHIAPAIVQQIYGPVRELDVIALEPDLERMVTQALTSPHGAVLDPGVADTLTRQASDMARRQEDKGHPACLLVPDSLRAPLARLLKRAAPRLKVLAHSEIPETHSIRIGSIIGGTA